ncbi:unnamed protein product [Blepharisma stoltei]|uniref:Uncharacterized protein n=1 Tax=Blepharisma stoltei TaxID=1481888 RepID=A0AAU9IUB4_9CILI|nr:unnamed protein product [Blepharisma stoltei]
MELQLHGNHAWNFYTLWNEESWRSSESQTNFWFLMVCLRLASRLCNSQPKFSTVWMHMGFWWNLNAVIWSDLQWLSVGVFIWLRKR